MDLPGLEVGRKGRLEDDAVLLRLPDPEGQVFFLFDGVAVDEELLPESRRERLPGSGRFSEKSGEGKQGADGGDGEEAKVEHSCLYFGG